MVLSGAFVASEHQQAGRIGMVWPNVGRSPLLLGLQVMGVRGRELALGDSLSLDPCLALDQQLPYWRAGGTLTAGYQLSRANRISFDLHVEHISADISTPRDPGGNPCTRDVFQGYLSPGKNGGQSTYSSLTFRLERDTRDDYFLATHGMYLVLSIELATKYPLGSDYEFSKYMLYYEHSFSWWLDHAVRFSFTGGLVQDVGIFGSPFFSRFFVGDHALFQIDKASLPRNLEINFSDGYDYGDLLVSFNLEYDVPMWSQGEFFYRGYAYAGLNFSYVTKASYLASDNEWSGRTKKPVSLDFGFKFDTPIGFFTLSLGYVMDVAF